VAAINAKAMNSFCQIADCPITQRIQSNWQITRTAATTSKTAKIPQILEIVVTTRANALMLKTRPARMNAAGCPATRLVRPGAP
jgi:hypothetical protein